MSMPSIVFICTANIFRSMVAEYALKAKLPSHSQHLVGSAGIEVVKQIAHPLVLNRLKAKGADASNHIQRSITRELLETTDLAVAMGINHQQYVREHFGREIPLLNEVCYEKSEPVLDIQEAVPNWEMNLEAARDHLYWVIDYIWDAMPALLERLPHVGSPSRLRGSHESDDA